MWLVRCISECVRCVQGLHVSKKKEQDSEDHMWKLAEREEGRLKQDVEKIERQLKELKERENVHEVVITYIKMLFVINFVKIFRLFIKHLSCFNCQM